MSRFLRHFPSTDPPSRQTKKDLQQEISTQVDEFLASGGEITTHTTKEYNRHSASLTQQQMRKIKRKSFNCAGRGKRLK